MDWRDRGLFGEPPWRAPLDVTAVLRDVPEAATIAGMYPNAIQQALKQQEKVVPLLRERYLPFRFYPLREYVPVLVEACRVMYPTRPLRIALRSLGRAAPTALLDSTLGRVTLGSAQGIRACLEAYLKTYALNVRPSHAELLECSARHAVVHMRDIHFFLDSHHCGSLEGVLRHAGVQGTVLIASRSPTEAYFHCSWEPV